MLIPIELVNEHKDIHARLASTVLISKGACSDLSMKPLTFVALRFYVIYEVQECCRWLLAGGKWWVTLGVGKEPSFLQPHSSHTGQPVPQQGRL